MPRFKDKSELEQYLRGIEPNYDQYAEALSENGVTSSFELADASPAALLECGVRRIHAERIIAQSKRTGKPSCISFVSLQLHLAGVTLDCQVLSHSCSYCLLYMFYIRIHGVLPKPLRLACEGRGVIGLAYFSPTASPVT